jgi:cytochrome c oxidase assembly factor CtaG
VTDGAARERPHLSAPDGPSAPDEVASWWRPGPIRSAPGVLAGVLLVIALVPPLSTQARRVEVFEALQFALLAIAIPALVVLSAPWRRLGLAARWPGASDPEGVPVLDQPRLFDRVAARRRRHPETTRSLAYLALALAAVVAWRLPVTVDALARHSWLSWVEALTLVPAGTGLWLELIGSPPFSARLARPKRIAVAAIVMWTIWVTAYVVGLSHASVYRAYTHVAGGLSVSADQALTTWVLWFASLCAFLPVIFANLAIWLRSDEDPDDALHRLMRDGRRRAGGWAPGDRPHGTDPFGTGVQP